MPREATLFPDERAGHGAEALQSAKVCDGQFEELLNFTLMKFEDLFPDDEATGSVASGIALSRNPGGKNLTSPRRMNARPEKPLLLRPHHFSLFSLLFNALSFSIMKVFVFLSLKVMFDHTMFFEDSLGLRALVTGKRLR